MAVKPYKFKIFGATWTVKLVSAERMLAITGRNAEGATEILGSRTIYINPDYLTLQLVLHELVHAHIAELPLQPAKLSRRQMDEVYAELIATRIKDIGRIARHVYKYYKARL